MKSVFAWPLRLLMVVALFVMAAQAHAQEDFLEPEKAFVFSARMETPQSLRIDFTVARGYYLYRERLGFTAEPADAVSLGEPDLPQGEVKYDPTFDKNMEVYHRDLRVTVPLSQPGGAFTLNVAYQGCADAGLCYPPMTHQLAIAPAREGWSIVAHGVDGGEMTPVTSSAVGRSPATGFRATIGGFQSGASGLQGTSVDRAPQGAGGAGSSESSGTGGVSGQARSSLPDGAASASTVPQRPEGASSGAFSGLFSANDLGLADAIGGLGIVKIALVFFGLGVLLALTPCVLPMVPILSALVVRDAAGAVTSRMRGVALAASYVAGMSVVYTALGVAAGLSGMGLAAALQKPWVLSVFASVLVVLALATFGAFSFQMPTALQSRLSAAAARSPRGRLGGAAVMGAISALIVGPCVAAPLAGALLYISQTGDVVLGALALFALAWGMGVPLLVVGASSTAWLPAAGPWMAGVNRLFGMLLLATAWFILAPVLPVAVQMAGWGFLLIVSAMMLFFAGGRLEAGVAPGTLRLFARGLGVVVLLAGAAQVLGAVSGGRDLWRPLGHWSALAGGTGVVSGETADTLRSGATGGPINPGAGNTAAITKADFKRVRSVQELDAALAGSRKPVMLDFYADWCVSCHEMERFTFSDAQVAQRLAGMTLLQADVTANNVDDRALLKRFRLFGPPGIIFFDEQGQPRDAPRVIGFQNARRFTQSLDEALAASR